MNDLSIPPKSATTRFVVVALTLALHLALGHYLWQQANPTVETTPVPSAIVPHP